MSRTNRLAEDVRMFTIASAIASVPQYTGLYSAGELIVTETTDEQDNKVIEYKERNGLRGVKESAIVKHSAGWIHRMVVYLLCI